MKSIALTVTTIAIAAVAATPTPPPEIVFALSPFQPPGDRTNQEAMLQRFLLRDRPQSTRVTIWDAWELKILCDLPAAPLAFDSPAARAPRLVPAFAALRQWATRNGVPGAPAGMENSAAIKLPEWLESVSLKPATSGRVLVIFASPFLLVPQEPSFSMVQTRYPSDAHLARPSAETIYGTADKHGHLANPTVLWAYGSENIWASEHHRERVTRWWSMFVASQGPNAVLAGFTSDTAQVLLESLRTDHHPIGDFASNPSDPAVVMHVATARDVPVEVPLPIPPLPLKPVAQPTTIVLPVPAITTVPVPQPSRPPPLRLAKVEETPKPLPAPPATMVTLDVRVTDSANKPIAGLAQSNFTILEDGTMQDIASFASERAPMSLVLLLDTSGSIASKLDRIRSAASTIIHQAGGQDEFCLVEFKVAVSVIQDFTSDASSADRALATLKAGGGTALLDSLKFALEYANQKGKQERKGIVLITDGGEADSHSTRADVIPLLQQGNVQFYSIAFPEGLGLAQAPDSRGHGVKAQPTEALARNLLDTLAKASSGGLVFYPRQAAELDRISESIVSDLRAPRYTLAYSPHRPQTDAGWRSIQVLVSPSVTHGPLTARTRAGYFAGQTQTGPGPISRTTDASQPSQ